MQDLQVFNFEQKEIRTVMLNGEPPACRQTGGGY